MTTYNQQVQNNFLKACVDNDVDALTEAIDDGAELNTVDQVGRTGFALAIELGNSDIIDELINEIEATDWDIADTRGQSPTHKAVNRTSSDAGRDNLYGDDVADTLLEKIWEINVNVRIADNFGNLPIHLAARNGSKDTVSSMVSLGTDINAQNRDRETPLHLGVHYPEVVKQLMTYDNLELNLKDYNGKTPLLRAIESSTSNLADFKDADPNIYDNEGKSAAHYAAMYGKIDDLNQKGINWTRTDNDDKRPIDHAKSELDKIKIRTKYRHD